MRLNDLRQKDVINCTTGNRLGFVLDLEFDPATSKICFLYVPKGCPKITCFSKKQWYKIPYCCVKAIGIDTILVDFVEKDSSK